MTSQGARDIITSMRLPLCTSILLLALASACSTSKQTYTVDLVNKTPLALSVGLIKTDGPIEDGWTSPEQIAIRAPQFSERKWGKPLQPGQSITIGPQSGTFGNGHAVLRVYVGDVPVSALIAYSRNDPGRLDLHLWPGRCGFVIDMPGGKLQATPIETTPPPQQNPSPPPRPQSR